MAASPASPALRREAACKFAVAFALLLLVSCAADWSLAADERPTGGRIPTVTRLVKLFLDRETSVSEAIRNGDAQTLAGFLTDDFEMRTGARATMPVPRSDWMAEVLRTREGGEDIDRMAVHDYGTVAVVSFTMNAPAGPLFVVDVWRAQGAAWRLAVRYAGPVATERFAIPGAGALEPVIPKKY